LPNPICRVLSDGIAELRGDSLRFTKNHKVRVVVGLRDDVIAAALRDPTAAAQKNTQTYREDLNHKPTRKV